MNHSWIETGVQRNETKVFQIGFLGDKDKFYADKKTVKKFLDLHYEIMKLLWDAGVLKND